ncbi:cytidine(C)-cytidine(C)-adenosine (A)]-adding enzyme [Bryobacterales bacterium F-183]|nr:cytidine(C)-cytidine(C)-adenosine (A)]-adding enzyme [Bryobacterales bacterium F-183]
MKERAAVVATTTFGESAVRLEFGDIPSPYSTIERVAATAIEDYANFIQYQLSAHGHQAYLVGGCVRDKLLNRPAKDFDVVTSALPDQIVGLFPNSGLVGAHFGVVLVRQGDLQVEVATFRSDGPYLDGRRPQNVHLGASLEADAHRRDFTINALYLDSQTGKILDPTGGQQDLQLRLIRAIGNPEDRFSEDHLRMLRAVRFAAELDFTIEPQTLVAIQNLAPRIRDVAAERIRIELERALPAGGAALFQESGLAAALGLNPTFHAKTSHIAVHWAALLRNHPDGAFFDVLKIPNRDRAWAQALAANADRTGFQDQAEHKRLARQPWYPLLSELTGRDLGTYPASELWPKPLLTGADLQQLGIPPGPQYKQILQDLETAQLNGEITTKEDALKFAIGTTFHEAAGPRQANSQE